MFLIKLLHNNIQILESKHFQLFQTENNCFNLRGPLIKIHRGKKLKYLLNFHSAMSQKNAHCYRFQVLSGRDVKIQRMKNFDVTIKIQSGFMMFPDGEIRSNKLKKNNLVVL